MPAKKSPDYLRRYTDFPALLHMLSSRQITLLDPKTWDDRNDVFFISQYKERKHLKSVLALCFSQVSETYHHWHVFSKGPAGVCIVFDRGALLSTLDRIPCISTKPVKYLTLKQAEGYTFELQELPFLKRAGFKPEGEFRVVYESSLADELFYLNVPIELSCIRSISLSPWLHSSLSDSTIKAICSIDGCTDIKVSPSSLISNEKWKAFSQNAT